MAKKSKRVSDDIGEVLANMPERKIKNTKNAILDAMNEIEEVLYRKKKKLLYEVAPKLEDECKNSIDSKDEDRQKEVLKKLLDFKNNLK